MVHFATLFDGNYLSRGLALLDSLEQHVPEFKFYVLCLDDNVFNYFSENPYNNVVLITLNDLEKNNIKLQKAKLNRSVVEYYFTLSPSLPLYILKKYPHISSICSLDSDIYFYNSPEPIFKLLEDKSIIITPHKYSESLELSGRQKYGFYNVSFQIFKNNNIGIKCLTDWEKDCIEWCYDYYDETNGGRFADQKYLDKWLDNYPNEVYVLDEPSAGLAVWNIDNYTFSLRNKKVYVNSNVPLIFYHFHHFKILNSIFALNGFAEYEVKNTSGVLINNVYLVYWNSLNKFNSLLKNNIERSVRIDLTKGLIKLALIHKTFFLKKYNVLIQVNVTFLQKLYSKIKKRHALFNRS
jgi:hypothetical protein